jgi:hypothetical protein
VLPRAAGKQLSLQRRAGAGYMFRAMKKILRDILLIAVLLGAIFLTPLVLKEMSSSDDSSPQKPQAVPEAKQEQAPVQEGAVQHEEMPPQPEPDHSPPTVAPGETAIQQLQQLDNPGTSPAPQPAEEAPAVAGENCKAIDLGAQHNYDPFAETKKPSNSFVMATSPSEKMTIAGGGFDLYKDKAGGDLHMDGTGITGIGIYDIRNDAPNRLYLSARALTTINGRHAVVIGDKTDKVYLDPCLEWNDPIAIEDGSEPMLRYDAHDAKGNPASVSVTDGVQVIKPVQK